MSAIIKLKTLEGHLGTLSGFSAPRVDLEQYETPAHIAAVALYTIQTQFGALENKLVLDAGCGTGMLSLGASLLGAGSIVALDIDDNALEGLQENLEDTGATNIDAVQCDFLTSNICSASTPIQIVQHWLTYYIGLKQSFCNFAEVHEKWDNYFDTVLMNPPFGTKNNAGIDMKFLKMGLDLTCDSVYSLHKSSTRSHIQKKIKEWGAKGSVIAELRYDLPATYKFHRQQTRDIAVDLWRIHHPNS